MIKILQVSLNNSDQNINEMLLFQVGHQVGGRHARAGGVQQRRGCSWGPGSAPPSHQVSTSEHGHGSEQVQGEGGVWVPAPVQTSPRHQHRPRQETDTVGPGQW